MMKSSRSRLLVPKVMAASGSLIALASLIGAGWGAALSVEAVVVVATIGYYVLGGRDSDVGAVTGSRSDERQAATALRATAFAGIALILTALGGLVVATAVGSTVWPFSLFCVVGGVTYAAGLVMLRPR